MDYSNNGVCVITNAPVRTERLKKKTNQNV